MEKRGNHFLPVVEWPCPGEPLYGKLFTISATMTFQFQGLEVHSVPPPMNGWGVFNAHVKCEEQLRHCRCPLGSSNQYFDLERAFCSLDLSAFDLLFPSFSVRSLSVQRNSFSLPDISLLLPSPLNHACHYS